MSTPGATATPRSVSGASAMAASMAPGCRHRAPAGSARRAASQAARRAAGICGARRAADRPAAAGGRRQRARRCDYGYRSSAGSGTARYAGRGNGRSAAIIAASRAARRQIDQNRPGARPCGSGTGIGAHSASARPWCNSRSRRSARRRRARPSGPGRRRTAAGTWPVSSKRAEFVDFELASSSNIGRGPRSPRPSPALRPAHAFARMHPPFDLAGPSPPCHQDRQLVQMGRKAGIIAQEFAEIRPVARQRRTMQGSQQRPHHALAPSRNHV